MATRRTVLTIGNIDDTLKGRLRLGAAMNGRSMEDQAREIACSVLSTDVPRPRNLAQAIHERVSGLGGADLPNLPREPV